MPIRPQCEPVALTWAGGLLAERVMHEQANAGLRGFPHFHDAVELVAFHQASGMVEVEGRRFPLVNGSVVFLPSMRHHDFEIEAGTRAWVLVQVEPEVAERLSSQPGMSALRQPFCLAPETMEAARVRDLAYWLADLRKEADVATLAPRVAELLLVAAARAPKLPGIHDTQREEQFGRLLPALQRLKAAPAEPLEVGAAASLCNMSSAYFCRRFRSLHGMTFGSYARNFRLHLAARAVLLTSDRISDIGYSVGFASPAHFTALFRQRYGVSPREYRRRQPVPD